MIEDIMEDIVGQASEGAVVRYTHSRAEKRMKKELKVKTQWWPACERKKIQGPQDGYGRAALVIAEDLSWQTST